MKHKAFLKEIDYIKNDDYKKGVKILLDLLPDYFYEIAASSSGKYHPSYTLGSGGLVRHTKTAVRIAFELLNNKTTGFKFTEREKDLILISLLLHDGLKHGNNNTKYAFNHPILVSNFIKENKDKTEFSLDDIEFIRNAVESHMGEWNTDFYGLEELPLPKNRYQRFVHMCDFLASRKFINVEFENNEIKD